jgi:hypothetical protein
MKRTRAYDDLLLVQEEVYQIEELTNNLCFITLDFVKIKAHKMDEGVLNLSNAPSVVAYFKPLKSVLRTSDESTLDAHQEGTL